MSSKERFVRAKYKVDEEKVKLVFFGQPGAGKSSVINAICGAQVAQAGGVTDTTKEAQLIEHGQVLFVDLPGYGTSRFPQNEYFDTFNPLQYDLFICVFDGKLHKADSDFFRIITEDGKPCIFVRNKADLIYDEGKTEAESREDIRRDILRQTGLQKIDLLFISARADMRQGIAELNNLIDSKMDAARREKYRMAAKSYTQEQLKGKKVVCEKYVSRYGKLAAANGFNPLLGIDAAIDVAILFKMYGDIRGAFGVTKEMAEASRASADTKKYLVSSMTKQGVAMIVKNMVKRFTAKTMLKFVPLLGQAAAAYMGYRIVRRAGYVYVDACYRVAQEELYKELNIKG